MQSVKSAAFWQILAVLFLLAAVAHVPAQTPAKNEKPSPILIARWSESDKSALPVGGGANLGKSRSLPIAPKFNVLPNALEQEAFDLINAERVKVGLQPLVLDSAMLYLAQKHSENMANTGIFSHRALNGGTVDERARTAGITDWQGIGENIAANQNAKNPVANAVECWLTSEGHRQNILSGDWTRSAIGVAVSSEGKYYFTQVFRD